MWQAINKHRLAAYVLWAGLFCWTFILVLRHNAAAFSRELPLFAYCVVLSVFTVLSLLALHLLLQGGNQLTNLRSTRIQRHLVVPLIVTTALPFILGITLPIEQMSFALAFSSGITMVTLLTAFTLTGHLPVWLQLAAERMGLLSDSDAATHNVLVDQEPVSQLDQNEHNVESEEFDEHILLQQTRYWDEQGQDCLSGMLTGEMQPGQNQLMLHLQFHPPFASTPSVEFHMLDDVNLRLKVGKLYPFGARMEARRSGSADATIKFRVEYLVRAQAPQAESA